MDTDRREVANEAGSGAMARVLTAEKQAAGRIEAARAEAAEILAAAQLAGRQEAERADRRLQALHRCARATLKHRQVEVDAEFQRMADVAGVELSDAEIEVLVARMARRLTGQAE